ncbi:MULTISPECIES: copper chaperone PCu(A)C [unclassified Modestobacter]|uniref:copper chaperone PCu(A)C n=1 Tax=unclassified Modestobacter TaxID=2643866 RepID=UPI0022AAA555|nr:MULTISPECIES: copper chaperone PCu(A)C [unclassified Modestobacter]MCZ2825323.1 copper chaperone PCu(A)C [Modestobacter sp. VKM Ac-2981]MCZ2853612.1 copper chaperone PCu(A)C [Modestobacter sp. VKM Ac-2982]
MNRAPRAAVMGVLLLTPIALTACSAGQVTQTSTQEPNVGNQADLEDLQLRALTLPYPTGGQYASGSDARLVGAIASTGLEGDTLVSIEGEAFDSVEVIDPDAAELVADGSTSEDLGLTIPPNGILYLSSGDGPTVALVELAETIGAGEAIDVTFTFEEAGEVTIPVPVGVPTRDLPRGEEFDFHGEEELAGEEGSVEENPGQEARERESADEEG